MDPQRAIIIGAGPAGLTAAYELLARTGIQPVVLEKSDCMGGLSRTVNYKGNRMDIGGHRFFSKSDRVMQWWLNVLPLETPGATQPVIRYQGAQRSVPVSEAGPAPQGDGVMLLRRRRSRIYFLRRLFAYPIALTLDTIRKLGFGRTFRIAASYLRRAVSPLKSEKSLEDFLINRFGRELYLTFFKSYTEKVWGVPCAGISAEWGAQRIKGLSIRSVLRHALKKAFRKGAGDVAQRGTETSLIEQFLYPKFGPGQMWEEVARRVRDGGEIHTGYRVDRILTDGWRVKAVAATHTATGQS